MIVRTSVPIGWQRIIILFKCSEKTCMAYICNQTIDKILARFDKQKTAHKIDKAKERKFQVENLPEYF